MRENCTSSLGGGRRLALPGRLPRPDTDEAGERIPSGAGGGKGRDRVGKWLQAGVLEGTQLSHPEQGTPQGGVISPLLANIYLHEVLDQWFEQDVKPRLKGTSFMVRYADDAVLGL